MVKLRVFGASDCEKCKTLLSHLDIVGMPYDYVDAFADETQAFCDEHNVDNLPHVQLISNEKVAHQVIGGDIDVADLLARFVMAVENKE